jgi:hypothetical protein
MGIELFIFFVEFKDVLIAHFQVVSAHKWKTYIGHVLPYVLKMCGPAGKAGPHISSNHINC